MKQAVVDCAREMHGSVRVLRKNSKSGLWNGEVKATVKRKEASWKDVF